MGAMGTTRMRLERLNDERERTNEKIEDLLAIAEEEKRDLAEFEQTQIGKYRERVIDLDEEIGQLAGDLERADGARDVSALLRSQAEPAAAAAAELGPVVYRSFGAW